MGTVHCASNAQGICAPSKSQDSQDMGDSGNEFTCNSWKGLSRTDRDCPCAVLDHERAWPHVYQGAWSANISVCSGFTHTFTPVPTPQSPLREAEGSTLCQPPTFTPLEGGLPCANSHVHSS